MDSKKAEEMIKTGKLLCDIDAALMIIPIFCEPLKKILVRRQKNTKRNVYFNRFNFEFFNFKQWQGL